jgi:hypothetical protein
MVSLEGTGRSQGELEGVNKPRIAILTSLTDLAPAYSLVGIILDQARMFQRAGYPYDLLCLKNFNQEHRDRLAKTEPQLSVRYELSQTRLVDYKTNEQPHQDRGEDLGFESQAKVYLEGDSARDAKGYLDILEPYDVIISHDLMFLSWFLPQNAAIRKCIEKWPEKNWLHWIHSAPTPEPNGTCYPSTLRFSAAPHSTYVLLNETQKLDCALMLKTTRGQIATVYNPKDVRDVYDFSREARAMIAAYDLLNHDILQVYPFSTPRWDTKGVKHLMTIFAEWKKTGVRAKLVLINANANSPKDLPKVEAMEKYAEGLGLKLDQDVVLSSRFADAAKIPEWRYCVPARVVRELGYISNLFVFPSPSECCSLIQAESAIAGNKFTVLNQDFPPMREFAPNSVMHYRFTINDPDNEDVKKRGYYECVAREIWAEMQSETAVMLGTRARTQTYNRDYIFKNQLEPLLWKGYVERSEPIKAGAPPGETRPKPYPTVLPHASAGSTHLPPAAAGILPDGRPDPYPGPTQPPSPTTPPQVYTVLEIERDRETECILKASEAKDILEAKRALEEAECPQEGRRLAVTDEEHGTVILPDQAEQFPQVREAIWCELNTGKVDYSDPRPGDPCPVFEKCSTDQRTACYAEAGHCPVLDEEVVAR